MMLTIYATRNGTPLCTHTVYFVSEFYQQASILLEPHTLHIFIPFLSPLEIVELCTYVTGHDRLQLLPCIATFAEELARQSKHTDKPYVSELVQLMYYSSAKYPINARIAQIETLLLYLNTYFNAANAVKVHNIHIGKDLFEALEVFADIFIANPFVKTDLHDYVIVCRNGLHDLHILVNTQIHSVIDRSASVYYIEQPLSEEIYTWKYVKSTVTFEAYNNIEAEHFSDKHQIYKIFSIKKHTVWLNNALNTIYTQACKYMPSVLSEYNRRVENPYHMIDYPAVDFASLINKLNSTNMHVILSLLANTHLFHTNNNRLPRETTIQPQHYSRLPV